MRGFKMTTVVLCATVWAGSFAQAQGLRAVPGPAELPPAGFTSGQYVDSKGCVFVRAGYGGTVTWVPRVGNNRRPLCGQGVRAAAPEPEPAAVAAQAVAPRIEAAAPAVAVAPAVKPAIKAGPMQTVASTVTPPAVQAPRAVRSPIPPSSYLPARVAVPAAEPAPAPASGRTSVRLVRAQGDCPAPISGQARRLSDGRSVMACGIARDGTPVYMVVAAQTRMAAAAPAPTPAPVLRPQVATPVVPAAAAAAQAVPGCSGLAQINQLYLVNDGRLVVRCGPKSGRGATYLVVGRSDIGGAVSGAAAPTAIPKGYKVAWDDGRLSATRGGRTAAGQAAMQLVWSNDTPRRLLDKATGQDVTMNFAYLQFPYTTYAAQAAAAGTSQVVSPRATVRPAAVRLAQTTAPTRNLSTKSVASPDEAGQLAAGAARQGFVQVGSFGVPENAAGAAARLRASGLPVQVASITKGGKALQIVLAGPFTQQRDLDAALTAARASGFADAFARN